MKNAQSLHEHFKGLQKVLEKNAVFILAFFRQIIIYMHKEISRKIFRRIVIKMLIVFITW